ncbi:MAG: type II toxin-antitoxin system VapC family toxin [Oculatellaceae cyanobacterium bins.114]|nr:type II toxin-antitoxin system VapC family toxin [Oculatellaceae cyanobacterium bins.114]
MNSILNEVIALDTNEFIFALRRDANYPACETLLFNKLPELQIYMPLQVLIELQRNLSFDEMRGLFLALNKSKAIQWDYKPAPQDLIKQWEKRGAKKGDAVIAAHLEVAQVRFFVSENRHFLVELPNLPFQVLSSEAVVNLLEQNSE